VPLRAGGTVQDQPSHPDGAGRGKRSAVLRALAVLAVIGIWLGIASVGGPAIGSLSTVQSNDQETFLPSGAESVLAADAGKAFEKSNALPAFVVFTAEGSKATPAQLSSWKSFTTKVLDGPVVDKDQSGKDLGRIGDYVIAGSGHAAGSGAVVLVPSADGVAALAIVSLDAAKVTAKDAAGKSVLGPVTDAIRALAVADAAGGQAHLAGPAGVTADLVTAFGGIDGLLLLVALGAVLIILFLVYRAVALPFVVLFTSICGLALAGGIVYLLADHDVIKLNGQSQGILFILVVGAATDYGLLLVARYREELERNDSKYVAIRRAWRACVEPIAASAGTVIIGLLCLLLSNLNSNKSLGPVGAIGIGAALIAALTLLPALLMGGRWLFWPRVPRPSAASPAPAPGEAEPRPGLWGRVATFVGQFPRRIWVTTAIVLGIACLAVPTLRASGTAQTDVFLGKVDSVAGQSQLVQHFPGGSGSPVVIIAPDTARAGVLSALRGVPGLAPDPMVVSAGPTSAAAAPLVVDGRIQIQATVTASSDSDAAEQTVRAVRTALHQLPGGGQILVGGTTAIQLDTLVTSQRDLRVIIPAILIAVLVVLMLLLRALVAPLLIVAATVLSFGTALGVSALMFNHVFDFPGADPAVPLFAFVFLVALGIDYSIFLMTRAREEVALHGPKEGVLRAVRVTGGVITSAGVVLATTFAALAVIPILFLAQIAFIVAFGVLLDTLIVRTLLVPALSYDLGRLTWWPITPKPSRHQRRL
jgi:RND superfamily putative drug exporter